MDPLNDTLSRHGVLPANATSAPRRRGRKATPAAPLTGPLWMLAKVGDIVRVEGDPDILNGKYTIDRVNLDALTPAGRGIAFRVGGGTAIYNEAVKEILERDGKPFAVTQDEIDAILRGRPLWEQVQEGDLVRVEGDPDVSDGDHRVSHIDRYLYAGPDSAGIDVEDGGYVYNKNVKGIIERDGKPYTGPFSFVSTTLVQPAALAPQTGPLWKRLKIGDEIEINRFDGDESGYDITRAAGIYTVAEVDKAEPPIGGLRVRLKQGGSNRGWIKEDRIIRIVGDPLSAAPASAPVRGNCLIHVDVPTILSNREKAEHKPVIVARSLSKIGSPEVFRELAWDGPSRFVHHEFVRIDGTDIQNWVETDATITGWRDGQGVIMLDPLTGAPVAAKPMTRLILGAFVIHVAAPVLMRNRREGRNDPVIAVRQAHSNWATDVVFGRRVEWSGPSRMVHRPSTPIPGTDGRGVSFIETDADITVYRDDAEPLVLRMPARAVAA